MATIFAGMFASLVYAFAMSCFASLHVQRARSDSQDAAHAAVECMVREIRQAGYSDAGAPVTGIAEATSSRLQVRSDWNGDGDFTDTNETIAYAEDTTRGTLTRASGGSSPQPMADHVAAGSLRFTYYDGGGAALLPAGTGLDAGQRAAVRRIDVGFTIAVPNPDPRLRAEIRTTVTASIGVRNEP